MNDSVLLGIAMNAAAMQCSPRRGNRSIRATQKELPTLPVLSDH
ncbi:MAG: hypothetical protein JWQ42_2354 [Edaphobacter sp.]|nr:hypothetical protein [Edaphobacter sp.]